MINWRWADYRVRDAKETDKHSSTFYPFSEALINPSH